MSVRIGINGFGRMGRALVRIAVAEGSPLEVVAVNDLAPADQLALCDGWETVDAEWIQPAEAIRLGEARERTVIFPTRMNLKLLAEASSAEDAVTRARARELVTVEPQITERPGGRVLVLPPNAGYGVVEEPLSRVM